MRRYMVNLITVSSYGDFESYGQYSITAEVPNDFLHLIHQWMYEVVYDEPYKYAAPDDYRKFTKECNAVGHTILWANEDYKVIAEIFCLENIQCVSF